MPSLAYLSLGCFKNLVDTEKILAELSAQGFEILPGRGGASSLDGAHALVINTCGFIDPAKDESIDAILEAVEEKKAGRLKVIAVVGCMVELWKKELSHEIPEVDIWLGLSELGRLGAELSLRLGPLKRKGQGLPRLITTPSHLSFLKISEGCSHSCTFCLIPRIRGPLNSRPVDEIIREANFLEARGVKEITLIAQDTAAYARDRGEQGALCRLLRELLERTQVPWYRLLYVHPENLDDEVLDLMAGSTRVLSYLDLPFQHISDKILRAMGRRQSADEILSLIGRVRERIPGLVLRTTLVVGFPGEREDDFERLVEFTRQVRFDWMGAFVFSPQEGTRAASLPDPVPEHVAQERHETLLDTQQEINRELSQERIGSTQTVLVDERFDEGGFSYIGRTAGQAYEIDGAVLLRGEFRPGSFCRVKITDALDYDLIGEKATERAPSGKRMSG